MDALNHNHLSSRLENLHSTGLLDSPPEEVFDRFTALACQILGVPIVLMTLVDENRQIFKSQIGLSEPWATLRQTPLSHSLCQYVVATRQPLLVNDGRLHPLFATHLAVTEMGVVAYAGVPLTTPAGETLGSLCAIDTLPRAWSAKEIEILQGLAQAIMAEIALRLSALELRAAKEEAECANRAKGEFLSRMSHELRTPLNAILGFGQVLEMDDLAPKQRESVGFIIQAGRHLLGLVNELLNMASTDAGQITLSQQPLSVSQACIEVVTLLAPLLQSSDITLTDMISGTPGCGMDCSATATSLPEALWILADPQRFKQVLLNLLSNAIKYNRHPGQIVLRAVPQENNGNRTVRIEVQDSGHGIPSEQLPKMFLPFERLGAEKSAIEGHGIGLSICKSLMEAMGGRIGVQSEVAVGSTFWIELPRAGTPWPGDISDNSPRDSSHSACGLLDTSTRDMQ